MKSLVLAFSLMGWIAAQAAELQIDFVAIPVEEAQFEPDASPVVQTEVIADVPIVEVTAPALASIDLADLEVFRSELTVAISRLEAIRSELTLAVSRMGLAEGAIAKLAIKIDQTAMRSPWWVAFGAALMTAFLALLGQHFLIRHQRKMSSNAAQNDVAKSYVDWQLKQLAELYGPLRALLGQSNEIYRVMNKALVSADSKRFRLIDGDDFDKKIFQINVDGEWMRFRTVQHLTEVYHKGYGVEPYFDNVIAVGGRMADLIGEKAGYVRAEDTDLLTYLSQYLAHYLVLSRLHEQAKRGETIVINDADRAATFPNLIQGLVICGYKEINELVMKWRKPSSSE